jgi:CDP-paratose 2-epimerase
MKNEQPRMRRNGFGSRNGANGHPAANGHSKPRSQRRQVTLITGGAGFIGTNVAHRLLSEGRRVLLFDNLSRAGVEHNLGWLRETHGSNLEFQKGDVRDLRALKDAVAQASEVFHFAAQVAVTTSLDAPIDDFEVNARGTLNLLEAARAQVEPPSIVFTSTNKVYGDLQDVKLKMNKGRYEPADEQVRRHGFSEDRPLAFHSPYGCSKGAACQYILDYARTFGMRTAVFRMSCIYGLHQFGNEDQGWVAHFLIKALNNSPVTIYGDGRQVRDILFVEDLVDALLMAQENVERLKGEPFNIGGGAGQTISLLELLDLIEELSGGRPPTTFADWRPADQQYYVSDVRKFSQATGWSPKVGVRDGVTRLFEWLQEFHPLRNKVGVGRRKNHLRVPTAQPRRPRTLRMKRAPQLLTSANGGR